MDIGDLREQDKKFRAYINEEAQKKGYDFAEEAGMGHELEEEPFFGMYVDDLFGWLVPVGTLETAPLPHEQLCKIYDSRDDAIAVSVKYSVANNSIALQFNELVMNQPSREMWVTEPRVFEQKKASK